ncbi:HAMP domain-containing histidine kinase [Sulfurimonas sp. HSL-3221]|uniref:sensor histidine kinase n=1 Tax=Thiomicrolovo sulfuroxydans TaxID=2894755 RepID=UPI001E57D6F5|nr:HAMP domain-containing sensor histidine kinase [Sulfurimonas sp. HSL-3221]UFS63006.1 HAMP domain-containing histidine kinase [Sulfurimonas sp. HSL-3221]
MNLFARLFDKISRYRPTTIIIWATLVSTTVSFVLAGGIFYLFMGELLPIVAFLSILMPLLLTPTILSAVLNLMLRMERYKTALEEEIEKNHAKDLLLFEQERFVLMGEMLSNISHQWRQPLNAVNLTLLSLKLAQATGKLDDETLDQAFETIEQNTLYLSDTIEDFRSFFQNRAPTKILPLKQIVSEMEGIVAPLLKGARITLRVEKTDALEANHLEIATAISQVLLNLISNAKDALEGYDTPSKQITLLFNKNGEGMTITVSDNGPGIAPEVKPKIFDPYFTTKKQMKGSGIGLHMSRQIIEKIFAGAIAVDTSKTGTTFSIFLPYSEHCRLVAVAPMPEGQA